MYLPWESQAVVCSHYNLPSGLVHGHPTTSQALGLVSSGLDANERSIAEPVRLHWYKSEKNGLVG